MKRLITILIIFILLLCIRMGASQRHVAARMETSPGSVTPEPGRVAPEPGSVTPLAAHFIDKKYATLADSVTLLGYLARKFFSLPPDERPAFIQNLGAHLHRTYKNKDLDRLLQLQEIVFATDYESKMQRFEHLLRKTRKWNDPALETYTLYSMWHQSYVYGEYVRSFRYARELEELLDKIDTRIYTGKSQEYFQLGRVYYQFKDYQQAARLMHKAISIPGDWLMPWNYLAAIHHHNGRIDSAAYYHRTILTSEQALNQPPIHRAIALSNLGRIEMERGNYNDALPMLQTGIITSEESGDISFSAGVRISLGECYLEKGDTAAVRREIASAFRHLHNMEEQHRPLVRLRDLYALRSRYHQYLGQHHLSKVYQDSAIALTVRHEQESGRHTIIMGEQQVKEVEIELKTQQIKGQRHVIISVVAALVLITGGLLVILRLYRKRDAAYRVLAQKAKEWAGDAELTPPSLRDTSPQRGEELEPVGLSDDSSPLDNSEYTTPLDNRTPATPPLVEGRCPTGGGVNSKYPHVAAPEDLQIIQLADHEMTVNHAYRELGITMDALADRIGVHRNTFSRAINRVTGGNFNQYINSYRVKEAVRLISITDRTTLYIDELSERVGFNNRVSFYRAFKQFTGLTPLEFQKQHSNGRKQL